MSQTTGIEWTDSTWNPLRGCSRVSEGCRNCYAERVAARFSWPAQEASVGGSSLEAKAAGPYHGIARLSSRGQAHWTGRVELVDKHLGDPLRWRKPRRVFVNSMSDLFHESVPDHWIDRIFGAMALAPRQTFQVLTKRPERMLRYLAEAPTHAPLWAGSELPNRRDVAVWVQARRLLGGTGRDIYREIQMPEHGVGPSGVGIKGWPLPNVWLGVSVENQPTADERIPFLLQTPAAVRFVSYEPALGPVDFERIPLPDAYLRMVGVAGVLQPKAEIKTEPDDYRYFARKGHRLDWVIVGGESGHGARPFDLSWARSVVEQGRAAGVPVFVKQLGARPVFGGCWAHPKRLLDRKGGDMAEWPEDLRVREFPA